jgi:hypothetical protein
MVKGEERRSMGLEFEKDVLFTVLLEEDGKVIQHGLEKWQSVFIQHIWLCHNAQPY